jgi:hypothetical protein
VVPPNLRDITAERVGTIIGIVGAPKPPRYTAAELEIIALGQDGKGRELTEQEINLSLAQARAIGEL